MIVNIKQLTTTTTTTTTTLIAKVISMRMFSEMASSFYSTVSLVTEKLTNFKAAIHIEMKSLYTFTAAPSNKQINLVS